MKEGQSGSLEEMIARVMQNPEIRNMIAASGSERVEKETSTPSADEISARLPEVMEMLKRSGIAESIGGKQAGKNENPDEGGKTTRREEENRRRLLSALKPYLSPERRDALEGILKMSQLTDLLGALPRGEHRGKGED